MRHLVRAGARRFALAFATLAVGSAIFSASAFAGAIYSQTQTLPVPPASTFQASAGGDGWSVTLSSDKVYNVFHHNGILQVACHLQVNAAACYSPVTVRDAQGYNFQTSANPGTVYDSSNDHLYVYAHYTRDNSGGVVCFDAAHATTTPFCGYTPLTGPNEDWSPGWSALSNPMQVGSKWYAFNYVAGAGSGPGARNNVLCFDLTTHAACAGQPYAVAIGPGAMNGFLPSPSTAAIGGKLIIPEYNAGWKITCFDTSTLATCAGSWPASTSFSYAGQNGGAFPLLDSSGAIQGFCVPTGADQCFTLAGASTPTPAGLAGTIGNTSPWNGPSVTIGPRVYVPDGNRNNVVECFDYSTGHGCPNFPKAFPNLSYIYTVNADPQRPTCLWVNADNGAWQIQSFDAYTGGACGQGAIRVLASQFVVPQVECNPNSYLALQVIAPARDQYTSGTIEFNDGAGNPIPGISPLALDGTGSVDLTGLSLNTATGLPQFVIKLVGAPANLGQVQVKLTWTSDYDPACVAPGTDVEKTATTIATSLAGGDATGDHITVLEGTSVTDSATLTGDNAAKASGTVSYTWYSDSSCTTVASAGADLPIETPGTLPASEAVTLDPGLYYVVARYSGDAGNLPSEGACGDEVLKVRVPDDTPPVITPTVTGTLGNNDWYTSNVTVHWDVTDPESAISDKTGCDDSTVTVDTSSITFTCTATSAGGTASQSVTLKRDATAPTLAPTVTPSSILLFGSATTDAHAGDAMSGLASSSCQPVDTSSAGAKTLTCSATDNAGNSASATASYSVYSAQSYKQDALARINAMIATASKDDAKQLADAAKKLAESLDPSYWVDGTHLQPKGGVHVFDLEKQAVDKLTKVAGTQAIIDEIVAADRILATVAQSDATAAGGDAHKLAQAQDALAKANAALSAGKYAEGIDQLKEVWQKSLQSVSKL